MLARSPLAPSHFPKIPSIAGVSLATTACPIKYRNRDDLFIARFTQPATVAGVFTKSTTAGEHVTYCRDILPHHKAELLIVMAGNANTSNGHHARETLDLMFDEAQQYWPCSKEGFYSSATGVIGQPVPNERLLSGIAQLGKQWKDASFEEAAYAIQTTDTFPKGASTTVTLSGKTVTISGIAKGSGMIAPNMATMLSYVFTDAAIDGAVLQALLHEVNEHAFNAITVDGDCSTSDTLLVFATGKANNPHIDSTITPDALEFKHALHRVLLDLALQIVKDGEGATKLIQIDVSGTDSEENAKRIAMSIANSPLVKTAITGCDANWGRIVMAIGKTEYPLETAKLRIDIGGVNIVTHGQLNPQYDESLVTTHMRGDHIHMIVSVGSGKGTFTAWTCNLTHRYIDINADYRS